MYMQREGTPAARVSGGPIPFGSVELCRHCGGARFVPNDKLAMSAEEQRRRYAEWGASLQPCICVKTDCGGVGDLPRPRAVMPARRIGKTLSALWEKALRQVDRLMVPAVKRPILCLDFDGVLHSYSSGWQGPRTIPDPPVPGAIVFLRTFLVTLCDEPEQWGMAPPGEWELHVYSSRSRYPFAKRAMKRWLVEHGLEREWLEVIKFPTKKPAAVLTIDDRAVCFDGEFPSVAAIKRFQPWNKRGEV